jgi:hypothetical protein
MADEPGAADRRDPHAAGDGGVMRTILQTEDHSPTLRRTPARHPSDQAQGQPKLPTRVLRRDASPHGGLIRASG